MNVEDRQYLKISQLRTFAAIFSSVIFTSVATTWGVSSYISGFKQDIVQEIEKSLEVRSKDEAKNQTILLQKQELRDKEQDSRIDLITNTVNGLVKK